MSDLRQDFLDAMSCVAATVNVVATDGPAGRAGVTVSAMSSVSADTEKPVLLVCVNDQSAGAGPIIENGVFTVNILRDDQSFVSDTFAGRFGHKRVEKFACAEWDRGMTGAPILHGALASFDCRLVEDRVVGQHHVFFGEVQQVSLAEQGKPLIYANRSYSTSLSLPPVATAAPSASQRRLAIGCLSSFAPLYLPALLSEMRRRTPELRIDVIEGDQAQVEHLVERGEVELGLVYAREMTSTLALEVLAYAHPYALFSTESEWAQLDMVSLSEISGDPLILLDQPLSRDFITDLFRRAGLEPLVAMRSSSFELVRSLVANGLGYSVLVTRPEIDCCYDGKPLVTRPLADDSQPIGICAAYRRSVEIGSPAKDFKALAKQLFGSLSSG